MPATLALAIAAEPAAAENTFEGSCHYVGYSQFWPGRKWVPAPSGYWYRANGTCTGKLNGKPFDGPATMDNYANMHQPMGCSVGGSTGGGPAYMTFITGPANSSAAGPPSKTAAKHHKKKKKKSRRHARHKRHTAKRARAAAARAHAAGATATAASGPSDQPPPNPPAPTSAYPMITAYSDEVNAGPTITTDLWGAFRGFAYGHGAFVNADPNTTFPECTGDGVPGLLLDTTYTTVTPLVG